MKEGIYLFTLVLLIVAIVALVLVKTETIHMNKKGEDIIVLVTVALVFMMVILAAVMVGADDKIQNTVTYTNRDGTTITVDLYDAYKISMGMDTIYYLDENHELKRRPGK